MTANKAFRFRLYPDEDQQNLINRTFGCARFVYNAMLADKIKYYKETGGILKSNPSLYKKDHPWLYDVDSSALSYAKLHLDKAFSNFFRNKSFGFPKFKSKYHTKRAYTTYNDPRYQTVRIEGKYIRLPKVGLVKFKQHRPIPEGHKIKSATITQEPSGKYYVSILTEYEAERPNKPIDLDTVAGLDYSSPHFYVDDRNETADMPHFFREAQAKLAREQRKLSRMVKGSNNYRKQKLKVARCHEKVRNCRTDWIQKQSRMLADRHDAVVLEDIDYKAMSQSLKLGKATMDYAFGYFRTSLQYKLEDQGKKLVVIDKWFPSSKQCRFCGARNPDLALSDREWDCPACGRHLLRDQNAAINIREEGIRMLLEMPDVQIATNR